MRRLLLETGESLRIAFAQIRANQMRSALTALGVVIGIVAVTLMGTAITGIDVSVDKAMAGFGDDIFYVTKNAWREERDWWSYRNRRPIRTEYAREINEWIAARPGSALRLAVPNAEAGSTITRGEYRVSGVYTLATSHDYPRIMRTDLAEGRFFSEIESQTGRNVIVIGFDVADALFPGMSPIGHYVRLRGQNFQVVGLAERQGKFLGIFSMDSKVIIPITTYRRFFRTGDNGFIRVQVDTARMPQARDELRSIMRGLRQLAPEQRDDFEINEQQTVREQIDPIKKGIAVAGLAITGLALMVGAVGIMNITYVSVKERTREIGTRKALGARRRTILLQFLIEAVSICLVGGLIGLLATPLLMHWVVVKFPDFPVVFSPVLVVLGLGVSLLTGVFSGFAPAFSASKLDPVEALRYE